MRPLRVLVVDDSVFNRRTIADILLSIPGVEVVGKAADGEEALALAFSLRPDLVTLDLEMPKMDGFTFLRLLMARQPLPVIVVSGRAAKPDVFRALELGALDFVVKPQTAADLPQIKADLEQKVAMVRQLRPIAVPGHRESVTSNLRIVREPGERPMPTDPVPRRVVVIAASTGGPPALVDVFSRLPPDLPAAVVVVQHMPERFTKTFADRLERLGQLRVAELDDREPLRAGRAVICPGGRCVELITKGNAPWVRVVPPEADDRYVPSADRLFRTAASIIGPRLVAVILTGMGDDGTRGAAAVRQAGGVVLAESEETAAIHGMPGAAVRAGAVDRVLPLRAIPDEVVRLVTGSSLGA